MRKHAAVIFLSLSVLILAAFVVVLINQTAQLVELARTLHPRLAPVVLYGLLALYAIAILIPVVLFITMPRTLRPPETEESPEYNAYLGKLRRRLEKNRLLSAAPSADNREYIENAFNVLDKSARDTITANATGIFIMTAVSQNGVLDAIIVFASQLRLIWQVAHIYNQRPSLREIVHLYANVAATTFLVGNIEDLEIDEQVDLIIHKVIGGSVFGGVPGASGVASFLTSSFVNGSVNALLTLRVGVITKNYFGYHPLGNRRRIRRAASTEAARLFGTVFMNASKVVTGAVIKAYKKHAGAVGGKIVDTARRSTASFTDAAYAARDRLANIFMDLFSSGDETKP